MLLTLLFACADTGLTGTLNKTCYVDQDADGFAGDGSEAVTCQGDEAGWVQVKGDCDDEDPSVNPAATEACNEVDDNCNGSVDEGATTRYYTDADLDGHGDPDAPVEACYEAAGTTGDALDCDDTNPEVNPDAAEVCNGVDDDCDGATDEGVTLTLYTDADGDGFGDTAVDACELTEGLVEQAGDCDDTDDGTYPDAVELCDEVDNDCDGEVDEDAFNSGLFHEDADGDGYGDADHSTRACELPVGYVTDATDCDDSDAAVSPEGVESCNGTDDDCDGTIDEDATDLAAWYADADGDRYGDPATLIWACDAPAGAVDDPSDCDDAAAAVHPGAIELCNSVDDDCDGSVDEDAADETTWYADVDADGHGDPASSTVACAAPAGSVLTADDCDDTEAAAYPGAPEICDGLDDDCDGAVDEAGAAGETTWYDDADGDGYGDDGTAVSACDAPAGTIATGGDCDDTESLDHPGAGERCDAVDNDCDGSVDEGASGSLVWYEDRDGDGFGDASSTTTSCDVPVGYVADATDCDDRDDQTFPGADETCDGADNDCDGTADEDAIDGTTFYADVDGDAFGDPASAVQSCSVVSGYVLSGTDCDDTDAAAHPGGTEVCDGIDNDCDGSVDEAGALGESTWYLDADDDGFGDATVTSTACDAPATFVGDATDCDDTDSSINPGATDYCDGVDDDCSGDEDGIVTFIRSSTGATSDVSATWAAGTSSSPASISLSSAGTVNVCPGTYYVAVTASATTSIVGVYGAESTTLSGAGSARPITATADLDLTDLTIADGYTTGNGGGVLVSGGKDLSATRVVIQDGVAARGGNLGFTGGGTLTLSDVELTGGDASTYGGGLWITGSTADIDGLVVDGNQADYGGGLYVYNTTLDATDATISNNASSSSGGGLHISSSASVTLHASTVSENSGSDEGGGAYVNGATLTIQDVTNIEYNDASVLGGGVMLDGSSDLYCYGTTSAAAGIWGNTSLLAGGVYMSGASGQSLTSDKCDWTASADNSLYDIVVLIYYYNYGNNQTFTCSGTTCS